MDHGPWLGDHFWMCASVHAHGQAYAKGNPKFENITTDEEFKQQLIKARYPEAYKLLTKDAAEAKLGQYFHKYVKEWHPSKDAGSYALYPFRADLFKETDRPMRVDLLELLEKNVFNRTA